LIQAVVAGFNGTVFAYGQTSSGKTHTMRGDDAEPGLIPRAIDHVFHCIGHAAGREFLLRVSYMELYNEEMRDLLAPGRCKLQVRVG
jgi:centromeric protein E